MPFLLFGVATVAFFLSHFTKADPLASIVSERQMSNPAVVEAARARWGLDRSLPEQYAIYIVNVASGDLGTSFRTRRPVLTDILDRLPATLELVIAAMNFGTTAGIGLGVLAARFRNTAIDHGARLFALVGSSIPVFWSGLILLYVFSVQLGWLPGPGRIDPRLAAPPAVTGMYTVDALIAGDLAAFGLAILTIVLGFNFLGDGLRDLLDPRSE
jgi:ABC-type dipeptide/oligopeptide/nickel transport system permease component